MESTDQPSSTKHTGTGFCTAICDNGQPCTCKTYDDPEVKQPGVPVCCQECCHGQSLHDGVVQDNIKDILRKVLHGKSPEELDVARKETNAGLRSDSKESSKDIKPKQEKPKKGEASSSTKEVSRKQLAKKKKVSNIASSIQSVF